MAHKLGLGSSIFAVSLAFSLVVMYDAANVRWHAGKSGSVLRNYTADAALDSGRLSVTLQH